MTSASAFDDPATPPEEAVIPWTTWGLIVKHKFVALFGLVLLILLLVIIVGGVLTSGPVLVSDSTTCTAWGSANQAQQQAYAEHYLHEHGPLSNGSTNPASVVAAINNGCGEAYVNDVEDTVSVVSAIRGQY